MLSQIVRTLSEKRLITLTGARGSGKTRLAIHAARESRSRFPDGVWMIDLASLSDPSLVAEAVASALGARQLPGSSLVDSLSASLRSRCLLLMLDNCEHVLDGCVPLAEMLLQACPLVHVLATTREPFLHGRPRVRRDARPRDFPQT